MATYSKLAATQQLLDFLDVDYADYCTVLGVIADDGPITDETVELGRSVLHSLLNDGTICVGDAESHDDEMTYTPWTGTTAEKIKRLDDVISSLGASPDLWDGFWVWRS